MSTNCRYCQCERPIFLALLHLSLRRIFVTFYVVLEKTWGLHEKIVYNSGPTTEYLCGTKPPIALTKVWTIPCEETLYNTGAKRGSNIPTTKQRA